MTLHSQLPIFTGMEHSSKGLGIVIRSERCKEADRLLTLFSPDSGLVRIISYGARKSIRAIKAPLYTEGTFSLERIGQSELWTIRDIDVISTHEGILSDLGRSMPASLFSELIITGRSADAALYSAYCRALDLLEDHEPESVAIAFIVVFLSLSGFIGDWESCPVCGMPYGDGEVLGFSSAEGVPVCHRCDTMASSLILPPNARRYVQRIQEVGLEDAMLLSVSPMQRHRIFRYFLRMLRLSYPGRLRSIESGIWDIFGEDDES